MLRAQWEADSTRQENAIARLQAALQLSRPPNRIECYDISTTQGTAIVASRVVFLRGVARKSEYRRFNIRTVSHRGSDDYQSMREALTRRFARYRRAREQQAASLPSGHDSDETWRLLPDLLIVDGGRGQLNIALEVLREFGLREALPVVALAKRFEELWLPAADRPLRLDSRDQALYLLQRIAATRPTASPSPATATAAANSASPAASRPSPVSAPPDARPCCKISELHRRHPQRRHRGTQRRPRHHA